jgi:hypothetical protein
LIRCYLFIYGVRNERNKRNSTQIKINSNNSRRKE